MDHLASETLMEFTDQVAGVRHWKNKAREFKTSNYGLAGQVRHWQCRALKAEAALESLVNQQAGLRSIQDVVLEVAARWGAEPSLIYGRSHTPHIVQARQQVFYEAYKSGHTVTFMEKVLRKHYSTILYGIYTHALRNDLPLLTTKVYKSWNAKYSETGRDQARERSRRRRARVRALKAAGARGDLRSVASPRPGIAAALPAG